MKNIGWTKKEAIQVAKEINYLTNGLIACEQKEQYFNITQYQWIVVLQKRAHKTSKGE